MAQTSFALMTNAGRAKEAAALANGTTIQITHIAIGDGTTVPSGGETALYHEVARKTISGHGTVVGAVNVAYFDCFLAAADGPFTIREAGLIDIDGDLIAIAKYDPPISKPIPSSGQTVEGTIRLEVAFSDVATVTIKVDPTMQVSLQRLTRLPWLPVLSMSQAAPPAAPAIGDVYLIPAAPTGAWAGQAGKIAEYGVAGWATMSPPDGHGISLPDGRVFERVAGIYVEKLALDAQSGKWSFAPAGGGTNALTVTLQPTPAAYSDGMVVRTKVAATNTGAVTINVNGLGVKGVKRADGSDVLPSDFPAGAIVTLIYDASSGFFRVAPALRSDIVKAALAPPTIVRFTSPGTSNWTVPAGVTAIDVELWGAGGGGGYNIYAYDNANRGGAPSGGAGGAYARKRFSVTPGQILPVTVGAGGLGGAASPRRAGQAGTASSIVVGGTTVTAGAGSGGLNSTGLDVLANSSSGGVATNGDTNIVGESGRNGKVNYAGGGHSGGGGGSSPLGGPSSADSAGGPGVSNSPGGGGGATGDTSFAGATGANGAVVISYLGAA
ncbi:hypothetical protein MAUB1S_09712 [Mycolicibacterium aubagnense]